MLPKHELVIFQVFNSKIRSTFWEPYSGTWFQRKWVSLTSKLSKTNFGPLNLLFYPSLYVEKIPYIDRDYSYVGLIWDLINYIQVYRAKSSLLSRILNILCKKKIFYIQCYSSEDFFFQTMQISLAKVILHLGWTVAGKHISDFSNCVLCKFAKKSH